MSDMREHLAMKLRSKRKQLELRSKVIAIEEATRQFASVPPSPHRTGSVRSLHSEAARKFSGLEELDVDNSRFATAFLSSPSPSRSTRNPDTESPPSFGAPDAQILEMAAAKPQKFPAALTASTFTECSVPQYQDDGADNLEAVQGEFPTTTTTDKTVSEIGEEEKKDEEKRIDISYADPRADDRLQDFDQSLHVSDRSKIPASAPPKPSLSSSINERGSVRKRMQTRGTPDRSRRNATKVASPGSSLDSTPWVLRSHRRHDSEVVRNFKEPCEPVPKLHVIQQSDTQVTNGVGKADSVAARETEIGSGNREEQFRQPEESTNVSATTIGAIGGVSTCDKVVGADCRLLELANATDAENVNVFRTMSSNELHTTTTDTQDDKLTASINRAHSMAWRTTNSSPLFASLPIAETRPDIVVKQKGSKRKSRVPSRAIVAPFQNDSSFCPVAHSSIDNGSLRKLDSPDQSATSVPDLSADDYLYEVLEYLEVSKRVLPCEQSIAAILEHGNESNEQVTNESDPSFVPEDPHQLKLQRRSRAKPSSIQLDRNTVDVSRTQLKVVEPLQKSSELSYDSGRDDEIDQGGRKRDASQEEFDAIKTQTFEDVVSTTPEVCSDCEPHRIKLPKVLPTEPEQQSGSDKEADDEGDNDKVESFSSLVRDSNGSTETRGVARGAQRSRSRESPSKQTSVQSKPTDQDSKVRACRTSFEPHDSGTVAVATPTTLPRKVRRFRKLLLPMASKGQPKPTNSGKGRRFRLKITKVSKGQPKLTNAGCEAQVDHAARLPTHSVDSQHFGTAASGTAPEMEPLLSQRAAIPTESEEHSRPDRTEDKSFNDDIQEKSESSALSPSDFLMPTDVCDAGGNAPEYHVLTPSTTLTTRSPPNVNRELEAVSTASLSTARIASQESEALLVTALGAEPVETLGVGAHQVEDPNPYYVEETAWIYHNPNENDVPPEKLRPIPMPPPLPEFPATGHCRWSFTEDSRVLYGDFRQPNEKVFLHHDDEKFLLTMMERDDVSVITEGLVVGLNPNMWNLQYLAKAAGGDVYHGFRRFQRVRPAPNHPTEKRQHHESPLPRQVDNNTEQFSEVDGCAAMKVSDFVRYLEARQEALRSRSDGRSDFCYEAADGRKCNVNVLDEVLYMIDFDMVKLLPQLFDDFVNSFKLPEILPGGRHCLLHAVNINGRPFMGPNMYVTPPGAFTHLHQDGHGTVDSGHFCVSGYNEVVMLRRLTERHKNHALSLLRGNSTFKALYVLPHGDGLGEKPLWPSTESIQKCKEMGYCPSVFTLRPGQLLHINKGRLHAFRKQSTAVLPPTDCHAMLRASNILATENVCVSVAWDWQYRGVTSEGINREMAASLECAAYNRAHQKRSLAIPETALLQVARTLPTSDAFESTGACSSFLGPLQYKGEPVQRFMPSRRDILRGILPSLQFVIQQHCHLEIKAMSFSSKGGHSRGPRITCKEASKPNSSQNPEVVTVEPFGNDFFCRLCHCELSNLYLHCEGCEKILLKDFNICGACFEERRFATRVQMHPLIGDKTALNHVGNPRDPPNQCKGCPCKQGPACRNCKYCPCSCQCHQWFALNCRFFTKEDESKLLLEVEEEVGDTPCEYADKTKERLELLSRYHVPPDAPVKPTPQHLSGKSECRVVDLKDKAVSFVKKNTPRRRQLPKQVVGESGRDLSDQDDSTGDKTVLQQAHSGVAKEAQAMVGEGNAAHLNQEVNLSHQPENKMSQSSIGAVSHALNQVGVKGCSTRTVFFTVAIKVGRRTERTVGKLEALINTGDLKRRSRLGKPLQKKRPAASNETRSEQGKQSRIVGSALVVDEPGEAWGPTGSVILGEANEVCSIESETKSRSRKRKMSQTQTSDRRVSRHNQFHASDYVAVEPSTGEQEGAVDIESSGVETSTNDNKSNHVQRDVAVAMIDLQVNTNNPWIDPMQQVVAASETTTATSTTYQSHHCNSANGIISFSSGENEIRL